MKLEPPACIVVVPGWERRSIMPLHGRGGGMIPDPLKYFDKSGLYGLTATGDDDVTEVEEALTDGNRWKGVFSVYDISHRFIVIPESRSWMFIGDRDADLAILGFRSEGERQRFVDEAAIVMFDSLTDAAGHARSSMSYALDTAVLSQA